MRVFYYVQTGHRIGLDRLRRALPIVRALQKEIDITLLCSDFRIASEVRKMGIDKSVGIDVARNIANIAQRGDKIIFDSDEAGEAMLDDMRSFFSTFIRMSYSPNDVKAENEYMISPYLKGEGICNAIAIDDLFFDSHAKTIEKSFFFGDDDYEKELESNLNFIEPKDFHLISGFYFFLDYEDQLKAKFASSSDFEEYEETIRDSKVLVTSSMQAVLESLASGGKPIYFQRDGYTRDFADFFKSCDIPVINGYNADELTRTLDNIDHIQYKKLDKSTHKIVDFIKQTLNL
ncbi:MAG: hypothetical protein IE916_10200 [Epsilonproteobacteria bacterium]|nr:hypothetical protein [Campylobacterota bacterium]